MLMNTVEPSITAKSDVPHQTCPRCPNATSGRSLTSWTASLGMCVSAIGAQVLNVGDTIEGGVSARDSPQMIFASGFAPRPYPSDHRDTGKQGANHGTPRSEDRTDEEHAK